MTVQQLEGIALGLSSAVVGALMKGPWTPLDADAWEETVSEVDKGWLAECKDVDLKGQFVAKRFPIQQKSKMRLTDDFSVCGVNSTVGLPEKLRVGSVDQVCGHLAGDDAFGPWPHETAMGRPHLRLEGSVQTIWGQRGRRQTLENSIESWA